MKVTFSDCYTELVQNGGAGARNAYANWVKRPGYQEVVTFIQEFDHERLYALTPADVRVRTHSQ